MEPRSLIADKCVLAHREEKYYILSNLLPYAQNMLLTSLGEKIRVLRLLEFFCHSALDALHAFFAKAYNKFDAQVSENLCQIRACQLLKTIRCFRRNKTNFFGFFESTFQKNIYKCQFLFSL